MENFPLIRSFSLFLFLVGSTCSASAKEPTHMYVNYVRGDYIIFKGKIVEKNGVREYRSGEYLGIKAEPQEMLQGVWKSAEELRTLNVNWKRKIEIGSSMLFFVYKGSDGGSYATVLHIDTGYAQNFLKAFPVIRGKASEEEAIQALKELSAKEKKKIQKECSKYKTDALRAQKRCRERVSEWEW